MKILAIVLAGGAGARLRPLTVSRSKPLLPFGGAYRLIDLTLSNAVNSGFRQIYVCGSASSELDQHLRRWCTYSENLGKGSVKGLSPEIGEGRYQGTADAIYQNRATFRDADPQLLLILSGDHIYRMDYRRMVEWHVRHQADLTIATAPVDPSDYNRFGIVELDADGNVLGFEEKPRHLSAMDAALRGKRLRTAMGAYVFDAKHLLGTLDDDRQNPEAAHDLGRDILPRMIGHSRVTAYDFSPRPGNSWRDIGGIDAYHRAHLDLISSKPSFTLFDREWPLYTGNETGPLHGLHSTNVTSDEEWPSNPWFPMAVLLQERV